MQSSESESGRTTLLIVLSLSSYLCSYHSATVGVLLLVTIGVDSHGHEYALLL